ncbi:MAG: magnesium transporter CorA family protein [bacterium]
MLKKYDFCDEKLTECENDNATVLVYYRPDEKEKRYLVEELKLDEHTLNSALDPDELSRLEFEPDHMALIFKRPKTYAEKDNFLFKVYSVGLFVFKDRLVIMEADETPLFEGKMFNRIQSLQELVIKLLYRTVFRFTENLKSINNVSGALEQQINTSMRNAYLIDMFTLEKSLTYYLNAINSNGVVMEKLKLNSSKLSLSRENLELLDDLMIENTQCYRQAKIYSDILSSMMDARVSIVSNNLNLLIKTLTIITIGIMIPTFVVSAFSMNVAIPLARDNPISFWIILIMAAASLASVVLYSWYRKW